MALEKNPTWTLAFLALSSSEATSADNRLSELVQYLNQKDLLKESVIAAIAIPEYAEPKVTSPKLPPNPLVLKTVSGEPTRIWLKKGNAENRVKMSSFLKKSPGFGFSEIYTKQDTGSSVHYVRTFRGSPEGAAENRAGSGLDRLDLLETVASPAGADVLAYREADESPSPKAILGVWSPTLKTPGRNSSREVRMIDLLPTLVRLVGGVENEGEGDASALDGLVTSPSN